MQTRSRSKLKDVSDHPRPTLSSSVAAGKQNFAKRHKMSRELPSQNNLEDILDQHDLLFHDGNAFQEGTDHKLLR